MKVIVLGATGMLGCYSALALKKAGHNVIAVGHRESDNGFFSDSGIKFIGGFSLEKKGSYANLPTDIDAIVHLAGALPAHSSLDPMPYVQSIVVGMASLCEWMRTGPCRRIVFNTTPLDVFKPLGDPMPMDDDAVRSFPKNGGDHAVYAICKNAAVDMLEHYRIAYGFLPCVFRHRTVYAWHPSAEYHDNGVQKILPYRQILRRCIAGAPVEVWGDPACKKELLYIDDFTSAICHAVEKDVCGIFNLTGVRLYTLEEQIQGFIDVFAPKSGPSKKIMRPEMPSVPMKFLAGEKVRRELGWSACVTWPEACKRMRAVIETNPFRKLWGDVDPSEVCL